MLGTGGNAGPHADGDELASGPLPGGARREPAWLGGAPVPVVLTLQPPQLLLQAPLPMPVLHQAFSLCQQGHLLRLHVGPLGLQLLVPGMHRD